MTLVQYNKTDDPTSVGVYACRVPIDGTILYEDKFLMWFDGRWSHCGSDQRYRGEVTGWIGPLERRMTPAPKKVEDHPDCCKNPSYCEMPYDGCAKHVYWR